jgi:hypothetical protein
MSAATLTLVGLLRFPIHHLSSSTSGGIHASPQKAVVPAFSGFCVLSACLCTISILKAFLLSTMNNLGDVDGLFLRFIHDMSLWRRAQEGRRRGVGFISLHNEKRGVRSW